MKTVTFSAASITLMALVITIIVLIILASISIAMISGNNSIINRTGKAKKATERAVIEEALNVAYINLAGKSKYSIEANLDDAVEIVQNQGYKDRIVGVSGGAYKLNKENVILSKTGTDNNTDELIIEKDTSAESGGTWYAVIMGRYFKIEEKNGDIKVAKEPSNVDPNSGASGDTINITSSHVTMANANIATFQVTEGKKVQLTASNEGTSTITINANGKTYSANITVVGSFEQAPANLDGALELLAATDTSNQNGKNQDIKDVVMTTSNPDVATVTTEGIVKCNKVDGDTAIISAKQGTTTRYFKVNSTATLATPTKMDSNKTINGQTTGTANNPIIPKDFYPINTEKAKWTFDSTNNKVTDVDKGLVIMDEKGNQFVWVPVRDIKDMVMCANNNKTINGSEHHCNIVFNGTNISCTATGSSDEIVGKLYATEVGEKFKQNTKPYTYTQNKKFREPDAVTSFDNTDTKYIVDDRATQLTKFKEMAISVAKNGGFYVGRYESSLINETTRVVAGVASMSAEADSANMWYGLYAKQNSYATENGVSSSVVSNMIWGSQYDAIMNWIGDLANSNIGSNRNKDTSRRTGSKATDKIKNIFDLYGLRLEWTMEACNNGTRIVRGGDYYSFPFSPSYRRNDYPINTDENYGSRPTLYIQ